MKIQNIGLFPTLLCLGLTLISGNALSDITKQKPTSPKVFSVHDTDKDGYLDKSEYLSFIEKKSQRNSKNKRQKNRKVKPFTFEEIDLSADGKISMDEMIIAITKQRSKVNRHKKNPRNK